MFSQWFSGGDCERYRTSSRNQRIDQVGSSLVQLRYAGEVIRQHLHEWLRFSLHLEKNGSEPLPALSDDAVQQYLVQRAEGLSASRSRGVRASIRICWRQTNTVGFGAVLALRLLPRPGLVLF